MKILFLKFLLIFMGSMVYCFNFVSKTSLVSKYSTRKHSLSMTDFSFTMAAYRLSDAFGLIPVCINPSSKTTTINDPTAGMTPDEIQNYLDNVGGGMCGAPEFVRTFIGLGLNLSLIVFGIFTLAYVVVGGTQFVLEKKVDDLLKKQESKYPELADMKTKLQSMQFQNNDSVSDDDDSFRESKRSSLSPGDKPEGPNREERRFKAKINKTK